MKSATIPSLRVTPDLRAAAESVLGEGETLSAFVETSLRRQIDFRRVQKEFIARGLAAREDSRKTGVYYTQQEVMASLRNIIATAEKKQQLR